MSVMEKNKTYLFQITIPSVQKFINSSRKTSDLWAGSFIVGYLMKELLKDIRGKFSVNLIYPFIDNQQDELVSDVPNVAIFIVENINQEEANELVDSLKNKFRSLLDEMVEFTIDKFSEDIAKFENSFSNDKDKYLELAKYQINESLKLFIGYSELKDDYKKVYENLSKLINYEKKSKLPDREFIENYHLIKPLNWGCFKNWEDFYHNEKNKHFETGNLKGVYRCSSCGEHTIIGATLEDWRGNNIWKQLWERNSKIFSKGERLCGVCLTKRYFRNYYGEKIEKENLGFPSTSEIGATLFKNEILEFIIKNEPNNNALYNNKTLSFLLKEIEKILNLNTGEAKYKANIVPLLEEKLLEKGNFLDAEIFNLLNKIIRLDGEWLLEDTWNNPNDYELTGLENKKVNEMLNILKQIYNYLENKKIEKHYKPSEYYAIIMLDGDNIGEKLDKIKDIDEHREFSKKISNLSKEFKKIVEENFGALVYSGGDDVLALIPMEKALDCAYEIQKKFKEYLKNRFPHINKYSKFSMSGAIIYAHHKLPLSYVLKEARKCEEKAKNDGKDRVCLKYIKSSLSSAETIFEWDEIKEVFDFIKNLEIPNSIIYDIQTLNNRLYMDNNNGNSSLRKSLLKALLKNKVSEEKIKDFIYVFYKIDDSYDFLKLANKLKVLKFIK